MDKTPTCPYCGGEMELMRYAQAYWHECLVCGATSPEAGVEEDALQNAMRRVSPWHSVKDGLPDNGTVCAIHGHTRYGAGVYDITLYTRAGWTFSKPSYFEVERWMLVPDAPKEGNHENG